MFTRKHEHSLLLNASLSKLVEEVQIHAWFECVRPFIVFLVDAFVQVPLAMLVLFPMFLFAGLLVNFNNCPPYLLWLQYISVFYYSFCLVSVNQWKDYGAIECSAEDLARTGIGRCAFMSGDDVLA